MPKANKARSAAAQNASSTRSKKTRVHRTTRFYRPKTLKKQRAPQYAQKAVASRSTDKHDVICYPLTTESAMRKIEDANTLVFIVDVRANKRAIKRAVKEVYEIDAKKVNTLIRPDGKKKAFVKLTADFDALDVANRIGII